MGEHISTLTTDTFDAKTKKGAWMIDFWAGWCNPCKIMAPRFAEASEEMKGRVHFGKVDVDSEQELAERFQVMSIPSLVFLKDGEMVDKIVGLVSKDDIIERAESFL
ncbi:thioredoxin [Candidatus Pacearchaeota archaeon]|nr:thioredoxin [Candidatus Pacearchaeota archaeon]